MNRTAGLLSPHRRPPEEPIQSLRVTQENQRLVNLCLLVRLKFNQEDWKGGTSSHPPKLMVEVVSG